MNQDGIIVLYLAVYRNTKHPNLPMSGAKTQEINLLLNNQGAGCSMLMQRADVSREFRQLLSCKYFLKEFRDTFFQELEEKNTRSHVCETNHPIRK